MKKILFLVTIIGISLTGYSQKLKLGVNVVPHFSWFSGSQDQIKSKGTRTGIEGGLVVEHYFTKNYAFATGVNLGAFGGKVVAQDSIIIHTNDQDKIVLPGQEVTYKLQYISVPIGLKLKTNQIGYMSYFARIGFTGQINIGAKVDGTAVLDNDAAGSEINLFNLAYHFGGGMEYSIGGNTALVLGIMYNNGFIDILTKQGGKISLSYVAVNLGVMF